MEWIVLFLTTYPATAAVFLVLSPLGLVFVSGVGVLAAAALYLAAALVRVAGAGG